MKSTLFLTAATALLFGPATLSMNASAADPVSPAAEEKSKKPAPGRVEK
jgi:hypothetical protein